MAQTDTFGVRVSLSNIEDIIAANEAFGEYEEDPLETVARLRDRLNVVGYRSSSAVFAAYAREAELLQAEVSRSIAFGELHHKLRQLQDRVQQSHAKGRDGIDTIHDYHAGQARAIVSALFESWRKKRNSAEQVELKLREIESLVDQYGQRSEPPTARTIRNLQAQLTKESPLVQWIEHADFPGATSKATFLARVNAQKDRLNALWQQMKQGEEDRAKAFAQTCLQLCEDILTTEEPPALLAEIRDPTRSIEEFSAATVTQLQSHVDAVFLAFKERVQDVSLLERQIAHLRQDVTKAHRRIFTNIDVDDFFARLARCKRWVFLREFPEAKRKNLLTAIEHCSVEIYKLQARRRRAVEEQQVRAAEVAAELDREIADTGTRATRAPGAPDSREELVLRDNELRDVRRILDGQQYKRLREMLDRGFEPSSGCPYRLRCRIAAQLCQLQ